MWVQQSLAASTATPTPTGLSPGILLILHSLEVFLLVTLLDASSVKIPAGKTHGKVYGRLVWNGVPKEKNEEIRCPLKKQWSLVSFPDYKTFNGDASVLLPRTA